jgi:hypothetical protein
MKNDCLLKFIADGMRFYGNKNDRETLILLLAKEIYPQLVVHEDIPTTAQDLALTATSDFLSKAAPACELSFINFKQIPFEDYSECCEKLLKRRAFVGLGFNPNRIFNGFGKNKHVSIIKSATNKGLTIVDDELFEELFIDWEDVERDVFSVNGGFWIVQPHNQGQEKNGI